MGKDVSYVTWAASRNEVMLWGLTGLAAVIARRYEGGADLLPLLRALAQKAITYIPDHSSPRSLGLATRCVAAIADAAVPESLPELLRVERGFRHGTIVQKAHRAVGALAARQGLGRDELLELAVERHGLAPDGTRRAELAGGWAAVLAAGPRTARVSYLGPGGKSRASLPAAVKAESADALAALQKDLKAVRSTVADERSRLDGLLAGGRSRPVRAWRERYLGHPLTGQLARTLIWQFTTPDGVTITGLPAGSAPPAATVLIMHDGTSAVPEDAEVRLWHPAAAERTEVAAWRSLLLQLKIMRPVRQAFREVYVPTRRKRLPGTTPTGSPDTCSSRSRRGR
jgi:uncharacterized protein DUF4132